MNRRESEPLDLDALLQELQAGQDAQPEPEGFRSGYVAVVGQPNVGKSTLMNRLIGQKVAIVSPKPQTTRRRILGILTREDAQLMFVDTPGIHDAFHKLGEYMNTMALSSIPDADVVLFVVEGVTSPNEMDREIAAQLARFDGPKLLLVNKIDQIEQELAAHRFEQYAALGEWAEVLPISALEGHGVEGVIDRVVQYLPEGPRYYPEGQVTDQTEREIAAEIVREAALRHLEQEVPHSINVVADEWTERPNGVTYISATIFVERDTQKGIVIGQGGKMLKRISSEARAEIERELGVQVYLDLWVKVRDRWRNSDSWLNRWGYKPDNS
ncbi:MAG TPA: GTPase Era [Ardenticatenaceae bacterium]|jgi:GTP-binding protein Era